MTPPPRTRQQRREDTLHRLDHDVDVWVATADPAAASPYLVPLSFLWDGTHLVVSTPGPSQTARNLRATGRARLGLGSTRDLALIGATVTRTIPAADVAPDLGDAFAAKTGFDPREQAEDYVYFHLAPQRIQAWREADELVGRSLMSDGRWL